MAEQHRIQNGEQRGVAPRRSTSEPTSHAPLLHPVLRLQRQVGNQAVASLLAQRQAEEEEELQMKRDADVQRAAEEEEDVQAKHDVTLQRAAEDEEEEAVQAKADPTLQRQADEDEELQAKHDLALQRAADEEEDVQTKRDLALQRQNEEHAATAQRKPEVGLAGGPVSQATAQQIQAMRGNGQPLDTSTRATMEQAFDTSFADVRVHTGREASDLNFRLGAQAFTTGSDIFLRDDVYRPGTSDGQHLLAHELTHVVQQRSMSASGGMEVRPAGDTYEQAADATADRVVSRLAAEEGTPS